MSPHRGTLLECHITPITTVGKFWIAKCRWHPLSNTLFHSLTVTRITIELFSRLTQAQVLHISRVPARPQLPKTSGCCHGSQGFDFQTWPWMLRSPIQNCNDKHQSIEWLTTHLLSYGIKHNKIMRRSTYSSFSRDVPDLTAFAIAFPASSPSWLPLKLHKSH